VQCRALADDTASIADLRETVRNVGVRRLVETGVVPSAQLSHSLARGCRSLWRFEPSTSYLLPAATSASADSRPVAELNVGKPPITRALEPTTGEKDRLNREPTAALGDGLDRVTDIAEQVRVMWVQQDPARSSLNNPPDPADGDVTEWAEFRVNFQANRVYETCNIDQPGSKKAMNRTSAIATTCNEVGYVPP
jgi:hypothetical protein